MKKNRQGNHSKNVLNMKKNENGKRETRGSEALPLRNARIIRLYAPVYIFEESQGTKRRFEGSSPRKEFESASITLMTRPTPPPPPPQKTGFRRVSGKKHSDRPSIKHRSASSQKEKTFQERFQKERRKFNSCRCPSYDSNRATCT